MRKRLLPIALMLLLMVASPHGLRASPTQRASLSTHSARTRAERRADILLARVDQSMGSLRDFEASLSAQAHILFLPTMHLTGHLYFKRPDHVKVDLDNVPSIVQTMRQNLQTDPPYHNPHYTRRWLRKERYQGRQCQVIVFVARDASAKLQTATVWIDDANLTAPRSVFRYKDGSECTVQTAYHHVGPYLLPAFSDLSLHAPLVRGTAEVTFTHYRVNTRLPDKVFTAPQ